MSPRYLSVDLNHWRLKLIAIRGWSQNSEMFSQFEPDSHRVKQYFVQWSSIVKDKLLLNTKNQSRKEDGAN